MTCVHCSIHDRIARLALNKLMREEGKKKFIGTPRDTTRERHAALMILVSFSVFLLISCCLACLGILFYIRQD